MPALLRAFYSPAREDAEAPAARAIFQEDVIVRRGGKYALPWELLHTLAIRRAELVNLTRKIGFHLLIACARRRLHFAKLANPYPQQLYHGLLSLHGRERIAEPLAPKLREDIGLADILRARQHERDIGLASRMQDARDGLLQPDERHGPGIGGILCPEELDEDHSRPRQPVPFEALQPVAHRMKCVLLRHLGEAVLDSSLC